MLPTFISDAKRLAAAGRLAEEAAKLLEAQFCVRLWDGSVIPLGPDADPRYFLAIRSAGVLGSLLRRPTLENLLIQYATGGLDLQGGDLIELAELTHGDKAMRKRLKERFPKVSKLKLIRLVLPLLFARSGKRTPGLNYDKDETGRIQSQRSEKEFIQFHYDLGNDFYQLFLDPEMQYSCAYFTDWQNSLAEAQRDKIDMICRKLGLQPGDRFLDIGCGWGALICHAAKKYGVTAHGVTLSEEQAAWARDRIAKEGLADQVTVELKGYSKLEGKYDKIASIGMYEHVGIANYPGYFKKLRSLLRDRGILLNHGITRRGEEEEEEVPQDQPGTRGHSQVYLPRLRTRPHRPLGRGDGSVRFRGARRRGVAGALCTDHQVLVSAAVGTPRRGNQAGRTGEVPPLGGLPCGRVVQLLRWLAANLPNGGDQTSLQGAIHHAAQPGAPLRVCVRAHCPPEKLHPTDEEAHGSRLRIQI